MNVRFKSWNCTAIGTYYGNNRKAVKLVDTENDELVAVATVNLPDVDIPDDCVFIKAYSENTSMDRAMINAGIIKPFSLGHVESGYVNISLYMLTEEALYELWLPENETDVRQPGHETNEHLEQS